MTFVQFLFPDARRKYNQIDMPAEIEALASELRDAGWSFEIECFPDTQLVHADCCDEEEPIADEHCQNGPEVPKMIERLVRSAHNEWKRLGKPKALGGRLESHERYMREEYGP